MDATKTQFKAEALKASAKGISFLGAQQQVAAMAAGTRFITNLEADAILNGSQFGQFKGACPFWVGTGGMYDSPGKAFGSTVELKFSKAWTLVGEVPKRFRGMRNTLLALEHPDYTIEPGPSGIFIFKIHVSDSKINVIEGIPETDGFYRTEPKAGIPVDKQVSSSDPAARWWVRRERIPWLGAFQRGGIGGRDTSGVLRDIVAFWWPDDGVDEGFSAIVTREGRHAQSASNAADAKSELEPLLR
jgi:hypothetical protein